MLHDMMTSREETSMSPDTMIDTGVPGTAAAHLDLRAANGTTAQLTAVWSTRERRCDPTDWIGEHATLRLAADTPPAVWDTTGCGDWTIAEHVQCGMDGTILVPRAVLRDGWLHGAALAAVARQIARWAAEDDADDRAAVRAALAAVVQQAVEEIAGGWRDRDEYRRVEITDPFTAGIDLLDDDGRLTAWAYDPAGGDGDIIEVTEHDLAASGERR
jgi:hypothetical protein